MQENEKQTVQGKKAIFRVTRYSRRQFLKSAAIVTAGTAIASVSLASACKSPGITTAETTTGVNPSTGGNTSTTPTTPPSSSPPASSSTAPATSIPPTTGYSYIPPTTSPAVIQVVGTACTVATDRVYSDNNIWVKSLPPSIAVMGVTPTMVDILAEPYGLSLSPVGTNLNSGDGFGSIEGYKLSVDLVSPISGIIIEANSYLTIPVGQGGNIPPINNDPFGAGWLVVVQLTANNELNSLLTPQQYYTYVLTL